MLRFSLSLSLSLSYLPADVIRRFSCADDTFCILESPCGGIRGDVGW